MKLSSHTILAFNVIDKDNARLLVRVTKKDRDVELASVGKALKDFTVIAASARDVDIPRLRSTLHDTVAISIYHKPQTREATIANEARMMALSSDESGASNLFMDGNEQVWKKSNGHLVRQSSIESTEALQALLASALTPGTASADRMAAGTALASESPKELISGQYAVFVVGSEVMDGYVLATNDMDQVMVLPRPLGQEGTEEIVISRANVITAFNWSDVVQHEPTAGPDGQTVLAGEVTVTDAVAFYKKVFGYNPEFWNQWSERVRSQQAFK